MNIIDNYRIRKYLKTMQYSEYYNTTLNLVKTDFKKLKYELVEDAYLKNINLQLLKFENIYYIANRNLTHLLYSNSNNCIFNKLNDGLYFTDFYEHLSTRKHLLCFKSKITDVIYTNDDIINYNTNIYVKVDNIYIICDKHIRTYNDKFGRYDLLLGLNENMFKLKFNTFEIDLIEFIDDYSFVKITNADKFIFIEICYNGSKKTIIINAETRKYISIPYFFKDYTLIKTDDKEFFYFFDNDDDNIYDADLNSVLQGYSDFAGHYKEFISVRNDNSEYRIYDLKKMKFISHLSEMFEFEFIDNKMVYRFETVIYLSNEQIQDIKNIRSVDNILTKLFTENVIPLNSYGLNLNDCTAFKLIIKLTPDNFYIPFTMDSIKLESFGDVDIKIYEHLK